MLTEMTSQIGSAVQQASPEDLLYTMGSLRGDGMGNWDSDCTTVQCLAHIIHLAVMALLAAIKAIKSDAPVDNVTAHNIMSNEEVNGLHPLMFTLNDLEKMEENMLTQMYDMTGVLVNLLPFEKVSNI